jgi:hypothetical protein
MDYHPQFMRERPVSITMDAISSSPPISREAARRHPDTDHRSSARLA